MSDCSEVQAKFTEYLDGRLNGREMQRIAAHLDDCRSVPASGKSLRQVQSLAGRAGSGARAADLLLRIRVAVSQERARAAARALSRLGVWPGKTLSDPSCCRPRRALPARFCCWARSSCWSACLPSLKRRRPAKDEPLGNATAPRLALSLQRGGNTDRRHLRPGRGRGLYQRRKARYTITASSPDPTITATRSQIENMLLSSRFEPARFFGQPVRGLAVLSFSGVSVRG